MADETQDDHGASESISIHTALDAYTLVDVPRAVTWKGRAAVHEWQTNQEEQHATLAARSANVTIPTDQRTGHGGRLLMADVQRAVLAKAEIPAPVAEPVTEKERDL